MMLLKMQFHSPWLIFVNAGGAMLSRCARWCILDIKHLLNEQILCVTHTKCTTGVYVFWFCIIDLIIYQNQKHGWEKKDQIKPYNLSGNSALKREIYSFSCLFGIYYFQLLSSNFIRVSDNWWTLLYQSVKPTISGILLSGLIIRQSASSSII